MVKIGLVELADSILKRLEKRGIKYPDSIFIDMKTIKTSLMAIESQFKFKDKNE